MSRLFFRIVAASAILLTHTEGFTQPGPPHGGPVTWPPTSNQCIRHNAVSFAAIGGELTRLYADTHCSTPPVCNRPTHATTRSLPDAAASSILWDGRSDHVFTVQEQDAIGARARNLAIARRPAGTQLYKLTFSQDLFVVPRTPSPSAGRVFATAWYAQCAGTGH